MTDEDRLAVFLLSGGSVRPEHFRGFNRVIVTYPDGKSALLHPDSAPFAIRNWYTQTQSGMEFQHFGGGDAN